MKTKTFKSPFLDVFKATKKALGSLDISIEEADQKRKFIAGASPMSLLSWGETIQIRFRPKETSTTITVDSESNAQLIDWGKNEKNESSIIKEIAYYLKKQ